MTQQLANNWGRWGSDDQVGALNLLTPQVVLDAARLIRKGKVYSLAVPLVLQRRVYEGGLDVSCRAALRLA